MAIDFGALLGPLVIFKSFGALLFLRICNECGAEGHLLLLPGCNRLAVRPDHRHRLLKLHGLTVGPDHHLLLRLHHHLLLRLHHLLLPAHQVSPLWVPVPRGSEWRWWSGYRLVARDSEAARKD